MDKNRVADVISWGVGFPKLRLHRQQSVVERIKQKLAPRYDGLFQMLIRYEEVTYKLELPLTSRIYPIFHVSHLKKLLGIIQLRQNYQLNWRP